MIGVVLRLAFISAFLYSFSQRDGDHWPEAMKNRNHYGGHCRFLTFLNVCLSIITCSLLVVGAFYSKANQKAYNLAVSLSLPASLVVSSSFWLIYFYDRELIHPIQIEPYYTQTMSIIDHGLILPVALFNALSGPFKLTRRSAYFICFGAFFGYMIWILYLKVVTGRFVYPFMGVMGMANLLTVFFPCVFLVGIAFLEFSMLLNSTFCTTSTTTTMTTSDTKKSK